MSEVKAIPEGFRSVTPQMMFKDAKAAIEFYEKAFGAESLMVMPGPGGQGVMHAEIKIGDSIIMMGEESPMMNNWGAPESLKGTTIALNIYLEDVDAAFAKAVEAGATVQMPPMDMFWGDRYCMVTDPFGHVWSIATHISDPTPEEIAKGAEEMFAQMASGECGE